MQTVWKLGVKGTSCAWGGVICPMAHIPGHDRSQMLLLPETVDDYVGPDNPVRFIEAFVDGLDPEAAGFARVEPNRQVGRAMHRLICSSSTSTATSIGSAPAG